MDRCFQGNQVDGTVVVTGARWLGQGLSVGLDGIAQWLSDEDSTRWFGQLLPRKSVRFNGGCHGNKVVGTGVVRGTRQQDRDCLVNYRSCQ